MNALNIAWKDMVLFFKDRGAVLTLVVLPLVFIIVFSGALAAIGGGGDEEDAGVRLAVVDLDGGAAADRLIEGIDEAGGLRVETYQEDEAWDMLDAQEIQRLLVIPAGFTADLEANRQITLRLTSHPDADPQETEAVWLVIDGVAREMSLEGQILASLQRLGQMLASAPQELQVFTYERASEQARSQFERTEGGQLVDITTRTPRQEEEEVDLEELGATTAPGFAVLFVFLTAQFTARSIYDEKRFGSFRRLLASPMSKLSLLLGKMLPTVLIGLIQMAVIFAFGSIGMRLLGLNEAMSFGSQPLAVILVAVLVAVCSSGLGLFIAALARTENQIGGLSNLFMWGLGIFGGSIIPIVFLENFIGPVLNIVPHYWANRAFGDLILRGLGLGDVMLEMAVLLGFTVLFIIIALWRFDFE